MIPDRYTLQETPSRDYRQRTRWNVRDSDATLIISGRLTLTGGSKLTQDIASQLGKPCLHVRPGAGAQIAEFISEHRVRILNVAGPRESSEPGVGTTVAPLLEAAVFGTDSPRP